ncbi:hypothetical protein EV363DRAFT_1186188 [Boletus edulis]|nr:hypothetical protein EV363DRAFT_1186188 [Boletus edulis]
MARQSRRRSRTPIPPPECREQSGVFDAFDDPAGTQLGGGRRQPSQPPVETPTRLHTCIKPTGRDTGVIQIAGRRRAQMFEQDSPPPIPAPVAGVSIPLAVAAAVPREVTPAPPISPHIDSASSVSAPTADNVVLQVASAVVPPIVQDIALAASFADDLYTNIDPALLTAPSIPPPQDSSLATSVDPPTGASFGQGSPEAAPSCTQSSVPITRIIPPTPFAYEDSGAPPEENVSPPAEGSLLSTPTLGRRSARVNKILTEGYDQLEKTLMDLIAQTSLTAQQVLDGWSKSHGRIINGTNHWNSYAKYLMKHEEQERRRLSIGSDDPITPTLRRQLYAKFKDDHGEQWQEILEIHDMLEISDSLPQTMAQRAQTFNKTSKRMTSLLDAAAAKHGFEAALVMCGKTVNEDALLGFVHTTAGAKKFFDTWCRADEHTIIGHLKAHVYHSVSLEIVSDTFDNKSDQQVSSKGQNDVAPYGDQHMPQPSSAPKSDMANHSQAEHLPSHDDMLVYIKTSISSIIKGAGGDLSKFKPGNFPWTSLAVILAEQGLVMQGWPTSVLMPGEARASSNGSTARTKGITVLKKGEKRALCNVFENTEISVTRVEGRDKQKALTSSALPVIIGAAPPADSGFSNAQQMFADGSINFEGPVCLPPSKAAMQIKCCPIQRARATADDPIVISDDSQVGKETIKKKASHPKVQKKKIKWSSSEDSSDDEARLAKVTAQLAGPRGLTLSNEDDYHDPGPSQKRKANELDPAPPRRSLCPSQLSIPPKLF